MSNHLEFRFTNPIPVFWLEVNLESGTRIRSDASVIVQGWVNGSVKNRSHIVAEDDIVVDGDVHYAHLRGRTIRIGGEAKRCVLRVCHEISAALFKVMILRSECGRRNSPNEV